MHLKMSSAICFNLDQSKILLSGNGLRKDGEYDPDMVLVLIRSKILSSGQELNPLPNHKFLDCSKLKPFADDKNNVTD